MACLSLRGATPAVSSHIFSRPRRFIHGHAIRQITPDNLSDLDSRLSRARRDARRCTSASATARSSPSTSTRSSAPCSAAATGLPHVDADPRRSARPSAASTTAPRTRELDSISIHTAASLIAEEPEYSRLAARLLLATIVKEVAGQNIHSFSQSIAYRPPAKASSIRRPPSSCRPTPASSTTPSTTASPTALSTSACAPSTTAICCATRSRARSSRRRSTSFCAWPAGWPARRMRRSSSISLIASHDYLPSSPTLFNSGTKHAQMSSLLPARFAARLARESIYDAYKRCRDALEILRRHRPRLSSRALRGLADPRHQRPLERHRSVAAHAGQLRRRRQSGRQAQRRLLRLSRALARRHRVSFSNCATTPAIRSRRTYNLNLANWIPDLFMQPRRRRRHVVALRSQGCSASARSLSAKPSTQAYEKAEADKLYQAPDQSPRPLRAHDAHARRDRQRLDDLQGRLQPQVQPDRQAGQRRSSLEPLHRDHRGHFAATRRRLQSRLDQPRAHVIVDATAQLRLRKARSHRAHRRAHARSRHRHQLLPVPQAASSNARWRPVGLGIMGLQDVFFQLRLPFDSPKRSALSARIQEEIYFHALSASCDLAEKNGPHPTFAETRARRGRVPIRSLGRAARGRPHAGRRCASASKTSACATRC